MRHLIDKSYQVLNGCWNCEKAFEKFDYDSCSTYFCIHKKAYRPKCGSVAMGENKPNFWTKGLGDKWEKWAKGREVSVNGFCKEWNQK